MEAQAVAVEKPFRAAEEKFLELVGLLSAERQMGMAHDELEELVREEGGEVLRLLLQGHLDLRSTKTSSGAVVGSDGVARTQRRLRSKPLKTIVGKVSVLREVLAAPGRASLAPLDAELNLPAELYSFGLQKRATIEAAKGGFDEAVATLARYTATTVPKRQAQELVQRVVCDFDNFYEQRQRVAAMARAPETSSILVLSTDGKGVTMLKRDLRDATRKAAEQKQPKLAKRVSKGEKRKKKRMAMVAAVYTVAPFVRSPEDIVKELRPVKSVKRKQRPRPENKRLWASLELSAEGVIDEAFREAASRDPSREKRWVVLVDGNETQLGDIIVCAEHYGVEITVIVDLIHVLEYVWKAAWAFCAEASKEAEQWVTERLLEILRGNASLVAGGMRRSATRRGLSARNRKAVDQCADYLLKYGDYLRYDQYLADGLPIATGVIEGACRHLVQDRMGITGARWSLEGAEAVLRARALRSSGDFDEYWAFHQAAELERNHLSRYEDGVVPATVAPCRGNHGQPKLRVVK